MFVPDHPGHDKSTFLDERKDPDLFDYELEVEPILQVLVGKTLEHARIEVIEEHEAEVLEEMRAEYKKRREAMLIETQRKEAHRLRRLDEEDRRFR